MFPSIFQLHFIRKVLIILVLIHSSGKTLISWDRTMIANQLIQQGSHWKNRSLIWKVEKEDSHLYLEWPPFHQPLCFFPLVDRKSTRLNSSHVAISYAVFCLKKKKAGHRQYMGELPLITEI